MVALGVPNGSLWKAHRVCLWASQRLPFDAPRASQSLPLGFPAASLLEKPS
jgi:hypothetical protein